MFAYTPSNHTSICVIGTQARQLHRSVFFVNIRWNSCTCGDSTGISARDSSGEHLCRAPSSLYSANLLSTRIVCPTYSWLPGGGVEIPLTLMKAEGSGTGLPGDSPGGDIGEIPLQDVGGVLCDTPMPQAPPPFRP